MRRAGRAGHEEGVPSDGGDLDRSSRHGLAEDVRHVRVADPAAPVEHVAVATVRLKFARRPVGDLLAAQQRDGLV